MSGRAKLVRCAAGDVVPDALAAALRDAGLGASWVRGAGVVGDVELRTLTAGGGAMERRFSGPMQIVTLEGAIGARSDLGFGVVLARETERGLETVAGTLVRARVVMLEVVAVELETASAVSLESSPTPPPAQSAPALVAPATGGSGSGSASSPFGAVPQRPVKPAAVDAPDTPFPDVGDVVEHFAFGTCDVLKTDGDRIHLRVHRDQRIKEIAPEMLRVVPLDLTSTPRRFRLERKL